MQERTGTWGGRDQQRVKTQHVNMLGLRHGAEIDVKLSKPYNCITVVEMKI